MIKVIHDILTDTYTEVELTEDEIALRQKIADEIAKEKAIADAEAATKAEQRAALLERLGITEQEAKLLLGGN